MGYRLGEETTAPIEKSRRQESILSFTTKHSSIFKREANLNNTQIVRAAKAKVRDKYTETNRLISHFIMRDVGVS